MHSIKVLQVFENKCALADHAFQMKFCLFKPFLFKFIIFITLVITLTFKIVMAFNGLAIPSKKRTRKRRRFIGFLLFPVYLPQQANAKVMTSDFK